MPQFLSLTTYFKNLFRFIKRKILEINLIGQKVFDSTTFRYQGLDRPSAFSSFTMPLISMMLSTLKALQLFRCSG